MRRKNSYRFLIDWRIDLNVDWSLLKSKDEQKNDHTMLRVEQSNDSIFFCTQIDEITMTDFCLVRWIFFVSMPR